MKAITEYLDLASLEPIKIQRKSGESYVLINEDQYSKMQLEIMSLQKRLLSMANILNDEVEEIPTKEKRLKRFKA